MVPGWKSGAWRSTTSDTSCANPSSRRPITLMGKTHGNVRRDWGSSGWLMAAFMPYTWVWPRAESSGDGAPARELRLVLLEERVHALEGRPGLAAAHGLAIQRGDREDFLGGRGEPHLV